MRAEAIFSCWDGIRGDERRGDGMRIDDGKRRCKNENKTRYKKTNESKRWG